MADGPRDYRDPKVTTSESGSSMKWLWYIVGAIVLLLLLAWLFGWFGDAVDDGAVTQEPAIEENEGTIIVPD